MSAQNLKELQENFALFDDWEERYRYLIDLGRKLPEMDSSLRTPENIVNGCTSQVWMVLGMNGEHLQILADSDAHIVRGLIALLLIAYNGQTAQAAQNIDIEDYFRDLGLDQHLSPNRRNGFFAMVQKIERYLLEK